MYVYVFRDITQSFIVLLFKLIELFMSFLNSLNSLMRFMLVLLSPVPGVQDYFCGTDRFGGGGDILSWPFILFVF